MKKLIKMCAALLITFAGNNAYAACSVATTSIVFSGYDVFLTIPNDSTGTITVTCDTVPPADVTVQIGPSLASGGFNPRQMRHVSGSDLLNYNLFTDAGRSAIWGDGTGGTSTVKRRVPRRKPWVTTVYGRIPAGQNVSVGVYSETVTVTIIW